MRRLFLILAGLVGVLVGAASGGDEHVEAKLFVRQVGDELRVAVRVDVDADWHVYHLDLGPLDAPGRPTEVLLDSQGVEWGEPRFPEPVRHDEPMLDTWSWTHSGTFEIYLAGRITGASPAVRGGMLEGMVCSDVTGVCLLVEEPLDNAGEGPDEVFAAWDARFAPAETAAPPSDARPGPFAGGSLRPSFGRAFDDEPQEEAEELEARLFVRTAEGRVEAAIVLELEEGWHLYHHELGDPNAAALPTTIELRGENVVWGEVRWPAPKRFDEEGFWTWAHEGEVILRATGELRGAPGGIAVRLEGQICELVCLPIALTLHPEGEGEERHFEEPAAAPAGPTRQGGGAEGDGGLLAFILLAIGGGIFALLMPCTYPMIPITISFFTKQAEARGGKVLSLSLAYGAGIVLIFIAIGVVLGPPILAFATHPVTNIVIGLLFVLFALVLFGVWNLQPPQFLMNVAGKASMKGGFAGVFLMGTTLVVTSFTCTAPFVGSLLSIGATGGDLGRIALGMGVFGLTMAVPFVFLSLVPGKLQALPQSGEWMHVLKVSLGFVELAAALKFFSNADLVMGWGLLSRELFLLLWAGIFAVTAFFLFGKINLKGERADEIGPARMVGALGALLLSLYCIHGYRGHELDTVMTAIVPNYSSQIGGATAGAGGPAEKGPAARDHPIVVDDYERARELAIGRNAPLLVNFTGFT